MGGLARVVLQAILVVGPYLMLDDGKLAAAVVWGGTRYSSYNPRPIHYVEQVQASSSLSKKQRLIIYHGPARECDLVGDREAVQRYIRGLNSSTDAVVTLTPHQMTRLVKHCDETHGRLFSQDPESYFYLHSANNNKINTADRRMDRGDVTSNEIVLDEASEGKSATASLWSLNLFNRILIFPGTKWCGQGAVAEHYSDIGYHSEADRCCRSEPKICCIRTRKTFASRGKCWARYILFIIVL